MNAKNLLLTAAVSLAVVVAYNRVSSGKGPGLKLGA